MIHGVPTQVSASDPSTTLCTPSSTAHTKGSYNTILTPTVDLCGIVIQMYNSVSGAGRVLFDIAEQVGGTDYERATNLYAQGSLTSTRTTFLPIRFRAGIPIRMRAQTNNSGANTIKGICQGIPAGVGMFDGWLLAEPIGTPDTANTRPAQTTAPADLVADSTWGIYDTSLDHTYEAIMIGLDGVTVASTRDTLVDVGLGATSSEVSVASNAMRSNAAAVPPQTLYFPIPVILPEGKQVSARIRPNSTSTTDTYRTSLIGFR